MNPKSYNLHNLVSFSWQAKAFNELSNCLRNAGDEQKYQADVEIIKVMFLRV